MSSIINRPVIDEINQSYEVDELHTKVNKQRCCITYAINRKTKQVIDFVIGNLTKENLAKVIETVLHLTPKRIYTDKLITYKSIIPSSIHNTARYQTNRIERFNLNLRTHIKRLNRKTICYSKRKVMLEAVLRIYFWGHSTNFNATSYRLT